MIKHIQIVIFSLLIAFPVLAEGDLMRRAKRLDTLLIDAVDGFSILSYSIETGVYYRWRIESDGRDEYKLIAPELFRESWIEQVVIDDVKVKLSGLHAIEFDDASTTDIWFVTPRPGRYPFFVEGLETQGFRGEFVVK